MAIRSLGRQMTEEPGRSAPLHNRRGEARIEDRTAVRMNSVRQAAVGPRRFSRGRRLR